MNCLKCFLNFTEKRIGLMNIIYADYNIYHNSIDICTYAGYILRIDCAKAEEGLKTTPNSFIDSISAYSHCGSLY